MALLLALSLPAATGAAAPAACRISQFALALGPQISEATGQNTVALRLINRGAASCVLDGYPRVMSYDQSGLVPFSISHGGDQMVTSSRPARIVVRPGRAAVILLNHYRCDRGNLREARTVRIGLSGTRRTETISIRIVDPYRRLGYCGAGDPGSILTVSPFEPSLRAARAVH